MVHLVQDSSLSDSQKQFLQSVLTEEGMNSLFLAASRLKIPHFFVFQKTTEILSKQNFNQEGFVRQFEQDRVPALVPQKINEKFTKSIQRLLSYEPLKRRIKQKTKIKPQKPICVKKIARRVVPVPLQKSNVVVKIPFLKLRRFCVYCKQALFKEGKLLGCLCMRDLFKYVSFMQCPLGVIRFEFSKNMEKEEVHFFLELIRKESTPSSIR
jgi:hypothetical protein